ncbi:xylulokinase [Rubrobacter xylanophilus DSM 9941]|uniref:Xylulose kinase n=1 Tax=Rubrobacter xylanophilus (strain DSM 9941 / JCM 11954 / NBRC 16129 / PRD-1) TaxID=266117 RepID=Q1AZ01_RUBXD|nr:xylulokinase [Rubrobacter xylanophilus]ABG03377.1 xylulokinase [Rubrobacter xylanophilus DSM 9941]
MSPLVGLDIGTGGARAVAVEESGGILAEATSSYPLTSPRPGWTEQDPEEWWRAAREVLGRVAAEVGGEVRGIGLTGQMHGSVFLDAGERPIRPALLWNDQRTARQCAEISGLVGAERLIAIAGNPALTGFQAPKILWLREEEPQNYRRVASVLLPKDYIRLRLTGERATDASDAAGTLLLDVGRREWSEEILSRLEIPRGWLPRVYEGPEATGALRGGVASELGLPAGIPVAAGGGDNAAAAVGVGVVREGILSSSVGTSGVLFAHTDAFSPDPSGRVHAFCHALPGAYHLMGVTLSAGGSLAWWRSTLEKDYEVLVEEAAQVPPGAEGLLFLPYLTGERTPHLDPAARGAFIGLTARHTAAHMSRAVMEGVVFSLRESLEILRSLGVPVEEVRATGGGARSPLWRQLQADIYNTPIRRTTADEGPAYGAALLGGVAAGAYRDVQEAVASCVRLREELTEPDERRSKAYEEHYAVYRSLYAANREAMHRLSELAGSAS